MSYFPKSIQKPRASFIKRTPRQRALAEWHGVDPVPFEIGRTLKAKPTSTLIPKILKDIGIDKRLADAEIVRVWENLIEPDIVAHAKPTGLYKGTLFVTVDSPTRKHDIIRWHSHKILKSLQYAFGRDLIAKIQYRL